MNDRRAIFSLIAMGRITPAQAERLLAVADERGETVLALAVCAIALCLTQTQRHELAPGISHLLRALLPWFTTAAHQLQNIMNEIFGGLL
jgi:hypothetical protein